jgi:hypothetical protein
MLWDGGGGGGYAGPDESEHRPTINPSCCAGGLGATSRKCRLLLQVKTYLYPLPPHPKLLSSSLWQWLAYVLLSHSSHTSDKAACVVGWCYDNALHLRATGN